MVDRITEDSYTKLLSIPNRSRWVAIDKVVARLKDMHKDVFTLSDVLGAIQAEGLPPYKTLNLMSKIGGELKFIGKHRQDQRWVLA